MSSYMNDAPESMTIRHSGDAVADGTIVRTRRAPHPCFSTVRAADSLRL